MKFTTGATDSVPAENCFPVPEPPMLQIPEMAR